MTAIERPTSIGHAAVLGPRSQALPLAEAGSVELLFTPRRFALLLGLLIFAAHPDVILGQRTFFYRDFGIFGYPLAHYYRECFWRGEVPLWNPLNNCGIPFLAQWNTMTLYPGSFSTCSSRSRGRSVCLAWRICSSLALERTCWLCAGRATHSPPRSQGWPPHSTDSRL